MPPTISCPGAVPEVVPPIPTGTSAWSGPGCFPEGLRVLLVDDEPMVADTVGEMLERMGLQVQVARHGQEALTWFASQEAGVDLVILDLIMPRMGGAELFRHLRALDPEVRVLLSSGYSLHGEARQVMEEGAVGFLQKPYGMRTLHQALLEVLPLGCQA